MPGLLPIVTLLLAARPVLGTSYAPGNFFAPRLSTRKDLARRDCTPATPGVSEASVSRPQRTDCTDC